MILHAVLLSETPFTALKGTAEADLSPMVAIARDELQCNVSAQDVVRHSEALLKLATDIKKELAVNDHDLLSVRTTDRAAVLEAHQSTVRDELFALRDDLGGLLYELEEAYYLGNPC